MLLSGTRVLIISKLGPLYLQFNSWKFISVYIIIYIFNFSDIVHLGTYLMILNAYILIDFVECRKFAFYISQGSVVQYFLFVCIPWHLNFVFHRFHSTGVINIPRTFMEDIRSIKKQEWQSYWDHLNLLLTWQTRTKLL